MVEFLNSGSYTAQLKTVDGTIRGQRQPAISKLRVCSWVLAVLLAVLSGAGSANAQTASGVITGRVVDASGAVIPGAMVTLISNASSARRELLSSETGDFTFAAVLPGAYSVIVELPGMKRTEKTNINMTASDRLALGDFELQVGDVTDNITVEAQGTPVQTQSQERAAVLTPTQLQGLSTIQRDYVTLARVLPGVVQDPQVGASSDNILGDQRGPKISGLRMDFSSFMVDGLATNDSQGASIKYPTNMDAIAEVKILMNAYSAENGRSGGALFQAVVKSGTQTFHGGAYIYKRHEQLNANSFFNNLNGITKPRYRYMTAGATIGGPVLLPGNYNRNRDKLFFFYSNETIRGEDPQVLAQVTMPSALERAGDFSQTLDTNGRLIVIRDPETGQAFPGNIIPANRINSNGQKLLQVFPQPNALDRNITKGTYNYNFQESLRAKKQNNVFRVDSNLTNSLRMYVRGNFWAESNIGNRVGGGQPAPAWGLLEHDAGYWDKAFSTNLVYVITPKLVAEFMVGLRAPWQAGPAANAADLDRLDRGKLGITLPMFYPDLNPLNIIPFATFGGVTNGASLLLDGRFPKLMREKAYNASASLSWIQGSHNFKFGFAGDRMQTGNAGSGNFAGRFDFGRDVNNPNDSNYAFSNALLGNFTSYQEITSRIRYTHVPSGAYEWFAQDNWKVTPKLTLDYGIRWSAMIPEFEKDPGAAYFDPSKYDPQKSVVLFQPALNAQGQRVARNPLTGAFAIAPLIGAIVPGSGDVSNGTVLDTDPNYPNGFVNRPAIKWGPRLGFAYDPFGDGKTAIRGGGGLMYNLKMGGAGLTGLNIPPNRFTPILYYGNLTNYINAGTVYFPNTTSTTDRNLDVPTAYQFSLGVQRDVGFQTVIDVAFVGTMARHLRQTRNINQLPYGIRFQPQSLDPTTGRALSDDFLRPYPGYSTITQAENVGSSHYNSLQVQGNRRFSRGLQFGASWTWSKSMDFGSDITLLPTYAPRRDWAYGLSDFDRPHLVAINWTWDLPQASRLWSNVFTRRVLDNWQISGIGSLASGAPGTVSFTTVDSTDLTGGGDGQRPIRLSDPSLPSEEQSIQRFFNPNVWGRPGVGDLGNSGRNTIRGPASNSWDLSFIKEIPMTERFKMQFRWEMYNAFNHTQGFDMDTTARFDATGRQVNDRFGAVISTRDARKMQASLRLTF